MTGDLRATRDRNVTRNQSIRVDVNMNVTEGRNLHRCGRNQKSYGNTRRPEHTDQNTLRQIRTLNNKSEQVRTYLITSLEDALENLCIKPIQYAYLVKPTRA